MYTFIPILVKRKPSHLSQFSANIGRLNHLVDLSRFEPILAKEMPDYPKDPAILKYYGHINPVQWQQNTTTIVKHYGRVSETPCFPGENYRKPTTNSEHPSRLSGTKIASQNRSDNGGRKRARNHSLASA